MCVYCVCFFLYVFVCSFHFFFFFSSFISLVFAVICDEINLLNTLSLKPLYAQISAAIISVYVCLFQCATKVVIPAMMKLAALSALVHIDQYQGMRPHRTTVRVSHLSCFNRCAIGTPSYIVTRILLTVCQPCSWLKQRLLSGWACRSSRSLSL